MQDNILEGLKELLNNKEVSVDNLVIGRLKYKDNSLDGKYRTSVRTIFWKVKYGNIYVYRKITSRLFYLLSSNNIEKLLMVDEVPFDVMFPEIKSITLEELEILARKFYEKEMHDFKGQAKVLKFNR